MDVLHSNIDGGVSTGKWLEILDTSQHIYSKFDNGMYIL